MKPETPGHDFLVALRGRLQCASPTLEAVGNSASRAELDAVGQALSAANLWLRPGLLRLFRGKEFPKLSAENAVQIKVLLAQYEQAADDRKSGTLSRDATLKASEVLARLAAFFDSALKESCEQPSKPNSPK